MTTKPGEIYLVDLGMAAKVRPMVVVSREDDDAPRALSICAPVTTSSRGSRYEVNIGKPRFLQSESHVNLQGLQAIEHHELVRKLGMLSEQNITSIKEALEYTLDL
jgi:mRNA interferase MazF